MRKFNFRSLPDSYVHDGEVDDFGVIYIQLDDYAFPDKEWTDFGLKIVYWWMDAFLKLISGEEKKVQCKFMDGNYRFDIEAISLRVWRVLLIREWANSEEVEQESEINVEQATESLVQVATTFAKMDGKYGNEKRSKNYDLRIKSLLDLMHTSLANAS